MKIYTFALDPTGEEFTAVAETEREARQQVWNGLSDEQKNCCACLEFVDEQAA